MVKQLASRFTIVAVAGFVAGLSIDSRGEPYVDIVTNERSLPKETREQAVEDALAQMEARERGERLVVDRFRAVVDGRLIQEVPRSRDFRPDLDARLFVKEMDEHQAARQRVKIRTDERTIGQFIPLTYPAIHWLPLSMTQPLFRQWQQDNGIDVTMDNLSVVLLGPINIKVSQPLFDRPGLTCCADNALLTFELANGEDVVELSAEMWQRDPGVYFMADPLRVADDVTATIVSMGARPFFSIVSLEGVEYPSDGGNKTISYAVRWADLEIEYGSHSIHDDERVIR